MRVTIIRIDRERSEKNPPTGGCMPRTGFETARVASLPPQSSASANSATWAYLLANYTPGLRAVERLVPWAGPLLYNFPPGWRRRKIRKSFAGEEHETGKKYGFAADVFEGGRGGGFCGECAHDYRRR